MTPCATAPNVQHPETRHLQPLLVCRAVDSQARSLLLQPLQLARKLRLLLRHAMQLGLRRAGFRSQRAYSAAQLRVRLVSARQRLL